MPKDRLEWRTLRGAVEEMGRPATVTGEGMGGEAEVVAEGSIGEGNGSAGAKGPRESVRER